MKMFFWILTSMPALVMPHAASFSAGGHITADATWSTDTVLVTDSIWVDTGVTLTITPGTQVNFQGSYQFKVMGRLLAMGTQQDSIVFTAKDTTANYTGVWSGIRCIESSSPSIIGNIIRGNWDSDGDQKAQLPVSQCHDFQADSSRTNGAALPRARARFATPPPPSNVSLLSTVYRPSTEATLMGE
jgi:hypothetical protein